MSLTTDDSGAAQTQEAVLVLGGTGQVGSLVVSELLARGVPVRAIVRSPQKVPDEVADNPLFTMIEGSFLEMDIDVLVPHFRGLHAVVCCLGKGGRKALSGAPDLLRRSLERTCDAIDGAEPERPVRLTFLASAGIDDPSGVDEGRRWRARFTQWLTGTISAHIRDYRAAIQFLTETVGTSHPNIAWSVVRPSFFTQVPRSDYHVQASGLGYLSWTTSVHSIAHFHAELVTDDAVWEQWVHRMPALREP